MPTALSITNPITIATLLEEALDFRSKFIISHVREEGHFDVTGILREVSANALTIQVSGLNSSPTAWIGKTITCYFKVRDHARKTDIFYNFTAPVQDVAVALSNHDLFLARPTKLEVGQRRNSIRLDPASDDILNFSLWEEGMMVFRCPQEGRAKLRPPLVGGQHFEQGLVQIQDISSGGIRIRLAAKLLKTLQPKWTRGTKFVIWLVLAEQDKKSHQIFWVKSRISFKRVDYLNKDVDFGLEFTHHGKNDQNGKIAWKRVLDHDIQELGAWAYQRYLERFRRGIA